LLSSFEKWTDLKPAERQLLELLSAGHFPEFKRLRAQWDKPFGLGVNHPKD
jgi:hypothetical protein